MGLTSMLPGSTTAMERHGYADLVDLVISVHREMSVQVDLTGIVPLTATEVAVMRYVNDHDGCSASEVAHSLSLHRSNVSPALKSLSLAGLLERRTLGRAVQLSATAKARTNLRLIRERWDTVLSSALAGQPTDIAQTVETLRTVESALVRRRLEQKS